MELEKILKIIEKYEYEYKDHSYCFIDIVEDQKIDKKKLYCESVQYFKDVYNLSENRGTFSFKYEDKKFDEKYYFLKDVNITFFKKVIEYFTYLFVEKIIKIFKDNMEKSNYNYMWYAELNDKRIILIGWDNYSCNSPRTLLLNPLGLWNDIK